MQASRKREYDRQQITSPDIHGCFLRWDGVIVIETEGLGLQVRDIGPFQMR